MIIIITQQKTNNKQKHKYNTQHTQTTQRQYITKQTLTNNIKHKQTQRQNKNKHTQTNPHPTTQRTHKTNAQHTNTH